MAKPKRTYTVKVTGFASQEEARLFIRRHVSVRFPKKQKPNENDEFVVEYE